MKKKISVPDLRRGMYVSELLGRHWRDTPFLFQGFEIQSDEQIEEIGRYCQHVYIDTEQGNDVTSKPRPPAAPSPKVQPTKPASPVIRFAGVPKKGGG